MSPLRRVLKSPLLHFVVLGSALFSVVLATASSPSTGNREHPEPVVITLDQINALATEITQRTGRPAAQGQLGSAVESLIDDELLYRHALQLRLDRGHPGIRTRLIQLARFVTDDPGVTDDLLHQEALALGLMTADIVIRRQLVSQMRLVAASVPLESEPRGVSDDDLGEYLALHPSKFSRPDSFDFSHIYFSKAKRGAGAERDARRVLTDLVASGEQQASDPSYGDPFLRGLHFRSVPKKKVGAIFGPAFAEAVQNGGDSTWLGPIASPYGWHLLKVRQRSVAEAPELGQVRQAVMEAVKAERRTARLEARLAQWRDGTAIEINWGDLAGSAREAPN
jgi:hypothetical protein